MGAPEAVSGSIHDRFKYTFRVFIELVVPDSEDSPPFLLQEVIAFLVALAFRVLATVEFNDQPGLPPGEIGIVRADRQLAREFGPQARQHSPKLALMSGGIVAQIPGALCLIIWNATAHAVDRNRNARFAHPPLAPPLQGGEFGGSHARMRGKS